MEKIHHTGRGGCPSPGSATRTLGDLFPLCSWVLIRKMLQNHDVSFWILYFFVLAFIMTKLITNSTWSYALKNSGFVLVFLRKIVLILVSSWRCFSGLSTHHLSKYHTHTSLKLNEIKLKYIKNNLGLRAKKMVSVNVGNTKPVFVSLQKIQ